MLKASLEKCFERFLATERETTSDMKFPERDSCVKWHAHSPFSSRLSFLKRDFRVSVELGISLALSCVQIHTICSWEFFNDKDNSYFSLKLDRIQDTKGQTLFKLQGFCFNAFQESRMGFRFDGGQKIQVLGAMHSALGEMHNVSWFWAVRRSTVGRPLLFLDWVSTHKASWQIFVFAVAPLRASERDASGRTISDGQNTESRASRSCPEFTFSTVQETRMGTQNRLDVCNSYHVASSHTRTHEIGLQPLSARFQLFFFWFMEKCCGWATSMLAAYGEGKYKEMSTLHCSWT